MITNPRVRRACKRIFGTVHLVRGEHDHMWVLPWEVSTYAPMGWRVMR